jgi:SNF2 family DNA or RNA helicase
MFTGTLKPYQTEAVAKMVEKQRILVAYEMGLGKTPMTIAALEALRERDAISRPILILCLASLKYQWQKEIAKFTDQTSIVIDGTPRQRSKQYSEVSQHGYFIMNYEQVVNDWETIKAFNLDAVVCDEATAIKGFRAKRAKKVKELAKAVGIKFALTGTPIENGRPEEIYSIMQFVDPAILGRFDLFDKTFIVRNHWGGVDRYRNLPTLHKTLSEHAVRKSQNDADVKPYLPSAVYREPLLVPLDTRGQKMYDYIAADLMQLLADAREMFGASFNLAAHYGQLSADDPGNELRGQIMSRITALRMLCSSPGVLQLSATAFDMKVGGSAYAHSLGGQLYDVTKRPKLDALIKYVKDHLDIADNYKAVVFTSYVESVRLIVEGLKNANITALAYTGQMDAKQKDAAKTAFTEDPEVRVLVSSDAGGYGVDLPVANLLVNYDQPWSSGLAVQRNGRINRASSTWPTITIQDILIKDSIEQRQYDMLQQKGNIATAILDGQNINQRGGVDLTVGSLIDFLTAKLI